MAALEASAIHLGGWLGTVPPSTIPFVLAQFETTLNVVEGQGCRIVLQALPAPAELEIWDHWDTPHDCLTYFADWRRVIAEAVASFPSLAFFSPAWLTEPVVSLRNAILADRAYDRLPILADALEEAGCDNRAVLDHLRANDDHSHMCWVLDVLSVGGGKAIG
jgi:hypothetical protein